MKNDMPSISDILKKKILEFEAETKAEVERLRHKGEQERQDNEVRRDNSRDNSRPVVVVANDGGSSGYRWRY